MIDVPDPEGDEECDERFTKSVHYQILHKPPHIFCPSATTVVARYCGGLPEDLPRETMAKCVLDNYRIRPQVYSSV